MRQSDDLAPVELPLLSADSRIRHGFFTRQGGVSSGLYSGLNCGLGSGDDLAAVAENRARIAAYLGLIPSGLVTAHQIHSPTAILVEAPWVPADAPRGDALVTRSRGIALGVLSADCVPVLFSDTQAGIIGAAHAGWRGALHGVLEATLATMASLGAVPAGIQVGIGPAIQQSSYEVGEEVRATFLAKDERSSRFFEATDKPGKYKLDLTGFVEDRLRRAGVSQIDRSPLDTLSDEARFFSFRRATHRGEPVYGRSLSAICMR